jgi:hypothetical protein
MGGSVDRRRFERYGHTLDVRLRRLEREVADMAAEHPRARQAVAYAAQVPVLSGLAGPVERRLRRRELAHDVAVGVGVAAGLAALAAVLVAASRD